MTGAQRPVRSDPCAVTRDHQRSSPRETIQTFPTRPIAMTAVRMFTTQVCPYCLQAKALLKQRGVTQIDEIRIDLNPVERDRMIELTGRRSVPHTVTRWWTPVRGTRS